MGIWELLAAAGMAVGCVLASRTLIHYFQLDGPIRLELIRYLDDFGELKPDVKTRGIYRHFAMEVENVDTLYETILKAGYTCLTEPNDVDNLRFRGFLAEDPNGVEVEFLQRC